MTKKEDVGQIFRSSHWDRWEKHIEIRCGMTTFSTLDGITWNSRRCLGGKREKKWKRSD